MAAGAWSVYNEAKKYLMQGDIDLNASAIRMTLHTSASNAATLTLSTIGSVSNEVTEANGYSSSGKALSYTWSVGASASEYRFDATAIIWTATGGNIANIKYAVISVAGGKLICFSQLTTSQFTLSSGSTLTITPSANGIFELN